MDWIVVVIVACLILFGLYGLRYCMSRSTYSALTTTSNKDNKDITFRQRVWQIPAALVPELAELIAEFEKESVVIPSLDFYSRFKSDRQAQFFQHSVMEPPQKKALYSHYEQNKREMQSYDDKWFVSLGKLVHRHFRDQNVRDAWFHKLSGIRISGNFYYPPGGFREWHTNKDDEPGWRVYYVRVTEPNKSWFNYVDPITNTMYSVVDRDGYFNLFDLNSEDGLLWHSVYSDTHRFSLGLHITDEMAQTMISRLKGASVGSGLGIGFAQVGEHVMD